jgi:hypothetical protein
MGNLPGNITTNKLSDLPLSSLYYNSEELDKNDQMDLSNEVKEYSVKRKYTEAELENPAPGMTKDIQWQLAWGKWAVANNKVKIYRTAQEMFDDENE